MSINVADRDWEIRFFINTVNLHKNGDLDAKQFLNHIDHYVDRRIATINSTHKTASAIDKTERERFYESSE